MMPRSMTARFVLLAVAATLIIVGSTLLGPTIITWSEIVGATDETNAGGVNIFWRLRVPRAILAAAAGGGLAIGGVVFQALFRNPLAEPYTLGVASGASLAAAIGFLAGVPGVSWAGIPVLTIVALMGALAALAAVFVMDRLRPSRDMARLLLAGVCVAYLSSAGILLATFVADRAVTSEIVTWMMGSLATVRSQAAVEVVLVLVPVVVLATFLHRALDLLAFDRTVAATRGVAVPVVTWSAFGLVGLLTAVIVANCGPIGFVGLMVPHMARAIFGARTLPLLFAALLLGAAFLAVCDAVARALTVSELPVGIVTNIIGAVFFFYLLATRDRLHAG